MSANESEFCPFAQPGKAFVTSRLMNNKVFTRQVYVSRDANVRRIAIFTAAVNDPDGTLTL